MRRNFWSYLFGAIFIISMATAFLTFIFNVNTMIPFVFSGIAFISLFVWLLIIASSKSDNIIMSKANAPAASEDNRKHAEELYKERVKQAIDIALGKRDTLEPSEEVVAKIVTDFSKKDICMICKLFLKKGDIILQCPACESHYHQDHLLTWIKSKKKCPVCSQVLLEEKK